MRKLKTTPRKNDQKVRTIAVYKMTAGGRKLKKYSSIAEAANLNGIDASSISKASRGIRTMAGGYTWQVA